jgi:Tol biopolymer transport system component
VIERGRDRERLHALLQAALERPPDERERWIEHACGDDASLRRRLTELVRSTHQDTEARTPGTPVRGYDPAAIDIIVDRHTAARLTPGQRLGRYEILEVLGWGGMGTVYRALDPSLGREVAIKALSHAFPDSGSLRRFEREARVLAALSHPNIAFIYGFEEVDRSPYLVLEHVDGETLAQRIGRGPVPWREAVAIAIQIVDGLEEAHRKGVTHRDLKPSNVMLAAGGRAKLVDFGLAKKASTSTEGGTEASVAITSAGTMLGTARYMSPEQIHSDDVDTRIDIWAFGCVLYEMLAGKPAFPGRSLPDVVAAVLRDEPDWDALPDDVPVALRRLLRRCVRRDLRTRLQHIGDARLDLLDAEVELPLAAASVASSAAARATRWIVGIGVTAILSALILMRAWSRAPETRPVHMSLDLPSAIALGTEYTSPFAIAPSGSPLAIEAVEQNTRRLYMRDLGDVSLRPLPGTEDARQPFFSTDGAWVGFFADRKLAKVPVGGGPVLTIADIGGNPRGAAWLADGSIIVSPSQTSGLVRISERAGSPVPVTTLDRAKGEYSHRWPDALPGGKWVLFTVGLEDASFDDARIEAVALDTGERRRLIVGAGCARYLPTGYLMFVRGGRAYVVQFDAASLAVRGTPTVVVDGIRYDPRNGGCHLAVSATGVMMYGPGVPNSSDYYLSWIDHDGRFERVVDTPRPFRDPRVSPDGRRVATVVGSSTESDLWVADANATFSRLSFNLSPHRPAWTPDGTHITVGAEQGGKWRLLSIAADGTGQPSVLFETPNRVYPSAWAPDGRRLVFQENRPETGWDLRILQVDDAGKPIGTPQVLAGTPFHEAAAAISPDGKWVAHESDEVDGVFQIYVRSLSDGGHKVRVSTGGARWPVWGSNDELYFWHSGENKLYLARTRVDGDQLIATDVGPVWGREAPPPPTLSRMVITVAGARYDVRGPRFLVLETAASNLTPTLSRPVLMFDWARRSQ